MGVDDAVDVDLLTDAGFTEKDIESTTFYRPVGCVHCIRGYRGRIGIFEALYMTKDLRKIILKSQEFIDEEALRTTAALSGMQTLRESAINLIKNGITSLETLPRCQLRKPGQLPGLFYSPAPAGIGFCAVLLYLPGVCRPVSRIPCAFGPCCWPPCWRAPLFPCTPRLPTSS
jgi:hypothetical protein